MPTIALNQYGVSVMNTYRPIGLSSGRWAVERFVDGESQGFTLGRYQDEAAATYMSYAFARMDMLDAPTPAAKPVAVSAHAPTWPYREPYTYAAPLPPASAEPQSNRRHRTHAPS